MQHGGAAAHMPQSSNAAASSISSQSDDSSACAGDSGFTSQQGPRNCRRTDLQAPVLLHQDQRAAALAAHHRQETACSLHTDVACNFALLLVGTML